MPSLRYSFRGKSRLRIEAMSVERLTAALEANGNSARGLAKAAGRNITWTAALLRSRGIAWKPDARRSMLRSVPRALLVRVLVECRMNAKAAAERLGVRPKTLHAEAARRGLPLPLSRRSVFLTRAFLVRWHHQHGVPLRVVARRLGVSHDSIYMSAQRLKVKARPNVVIVGPDRGKALPHPFTKPWDFDLSPAEIERAEMERVLAAAAKRAESKIVLATPQD